MVFFDVPDLNDSIGRVELAGKSYNIRFTYNSYGDYWSFGLYDDNLNPILGMTKMVPFSPLTNYYTYTDFPDGYFGVWGIAIPPGRWDFLYGSAEFGFISREEVGKDWNPYGELVTDL